MRTPPPLLKYLARAVLPVLGAAPVDDFLAPVLPDVAREVWTQWGAGADEARLRAELQSLARAPARHVGQQAERLAERVASGRPLTLQRTLAAYLAQVPAAIRQGLRRPSDPTGTTLPAGLRLRQAGDLLRFLPTRLPRFRPGDRWPRAGSWELLELLGFGGLGEVWKARDLSGPGTPLAALRFCFDPVAQRALRNQAELLERVRQQARHPGIVTLRDLHLDAEPPCLVYEYVTGGDLAGLIHEWHAAPTGLAPWFLERAARLVVELATSAGFAHRLEPPLVHRDLKPANVLIQPARGTGGPKIADWGISEIAARQAIDRETRLGCRAGPVAALRGAHTPLYASPQHVCGERPDPRDDVHALGVLWYQVLSGDLGTERPDGALLRQRLTVRGLPAPLLDLLSACLVEDPAGRPADAAELAARLTALLGPLRTPPEAAGAGAGGGWPMEGPTLTVSAEGRGQYRRIGDALRQAGPGARILVGPGLYRESLVLSRRVALLGDGPRAAIVVECTHGDGVYSRADEAVVRGLTLRGRAATHHNRYFTVEVVQGRLLLEDCDLTSDSLACLAIHGARAEPVVRRCTIHHGKTGGIFVWDHARGVIEDCDVTANTYAGVEIKQGAGPLVRRCRIHDQPTHNGIMVWDHGLGIIEDCDVFGNGSAGVRISDGSNPVLRRCTIHDGKATGVYVCDRGEGVLEDCTLSGHVHSEIEVRGAAPVIRRCRIRGGKVGGLFFHENAGGTVEDCDVAEAPTGGVEIRRGADPVLRRCKFHDGKASGIFVQDSGRGTLEDCTSAGNAGPGVSIKTGGDPVLRRCKVRDDRHGGILVSDSGRGTVEDCDVAGNVQAGIEVRGGDVVVRRCAVRAGKSAGVLVDAGGRATVEDCDIAGNVGVGAATQQGGELVLRRCRVRDGQAGGVLADDKGKGTLEECQITGNALAGVEIRQGGDLVVRRCRIGRGKAPAVWVHDGGIGTVEDCDVTGEEEGAWRIEDGCQVRRRGNRG